MSKLLLSTILASGLLLAGGSAHAGDADYNKEAKTTQTEQQMNQETDAVNDTKATTDSMSDAATDGNYAGEVLGSKVIPFRLRIKKERNTRYR